MSHTYYAHLQIVGLKRRREIGIERYHTMTRASVAILVLAPRAEAWSADDGRLFI